MHDSPWRLTPLRSLALAALALGGVPRAAGAQAQFRPYGRGCTYDGQLCSIGHRGAPTVGRSFAITYSGPNHVQPTPRARQFDVHPHLAFGLSSTLPTLLPTGLLPLQPDGCEVHVAAQALVATARELSAWPLSVFEDHIDVLVPAAAELVGAVFFTQWFTTVRDSYTGTLAAVATSDAAIVILGA